MFEIVWSTDAATDYEKTVEYWLDRNKSPLYPERIVDAVEQKEDLLAANPLIGTPIGFKDTYKVYLLEFFVLFYRVNRIDRTVEILTFSDGRRNPEELSL